MATINYDVRTNPMPEPMHSKLRKAYNFVAGVANELSNTPAAYRPAAERRFKGAVKWYNRIAARYENAPNYFEMVRYVIYGDTDIETADVD